MARLGTVRRDEASHVDRGNGEVECGVAITPVVKANARVDWLGVGVDDEVVTAAVDRIELTLEGISGDRHSGFARRADVRVPWFRRGERIHNERQFTIVSSEDLAEIAARLALPRVEAAWLGANLMVSGLARFSLLPRGTRLFFSSGAVLVVTAQNAPCRIAGRALAQAAGGDESVPFQFVKASKRLRGVTANVDRAGAIEVSDDISVRVPEQWIWYP